MAFLKRLFGQRVRQSPALPTRGPSDALQTQARPGSTRTTTGTEVAGATEAPAEGATPDREQAIIARVAAAFSGMMLDARAVDVHTLEGGLSPTLRFTLNEAASTDLPRDRITANEESVEELADEVIAELRRQVV
jgi:hypothetical protein